MPELSTYRCDRCDYSTCRKYNYLKHIKTDKHKSLLLGDAQKCPFFSPPNPYTPSIPSIPSIPSNESGYRCPNCDRKYMAQRSLWRHSKQCVSSVKSEKSNTAVFDIFTATITELCKSNAELSKLNQIQQSQMTQMFTAFLEASKNMQVSSQSAFPASNAITTNNVTINGDITKNNNSNNKTFNLNMFLNETCKDAMNMSDFVKTIELNTDDMENVGTHGFIKGISKIFIENLEKTEVTKRPIHCSDSKREVLYIKDDNKWERDNINSQKLVNAVRVVEHKNLNLINQWAKEHPECENSDTQANRMYMTLSKHALDGDEDNVMKVAKNIAHNVIIDKDEYSF